MRTMIVFLLFLCSASTSAFAETVEDRIKRMEEDIKKQEETLKNQQKTLDELKEQSQPAKPVEQPPAPHSQRGITGSTTNPGESTCRRLLL